jgi:UDP-2,3-diacylglucosamine hydrolase
MPTPDAAPAEADLAGLADAPLALLGDAHLRENDPELDAFIRFLETLPRDIRTLVILGDLFAAWIGREDLLRPHQDRVVGALRRLRARGCRLLYVEGNHDFFLAPLYGGDPFDRVAPEDLDLKGAGRALHLAHGDRVNHRDRQYLAWRALSKSRLFFRAFNLLPAGARQRLVDALERSLARTNMEFRGGFPYGECEAYARARIRAGTDLLVFGHFHEELRLDYREGPRHGSVFVLPAWRSGHRYLRIDPGSEPAFVSA